MISIVKETYFKDWIIWTGFMGQVCRLSYGPPKFYETFVLKNNEVDEEYSNAYCTKEKAIEGHDEIVEEIKIL